MPPPLRLPLSIYEVRDWSIEIVVTSRRPEEHLIDVGIRFNHEKIVWLFAHVDSLEEANHWLARIEAGQLTLEEIMAMPRWWQTFAPEDRALSHPAQSRVIHSIAFTRPFTEPAHWSVVPIDTTTLIPEHVDLGIRLDHAEDILIFAQAISLSEAADLLANVATGKLTVQEILSKPKARAYRLPEDEHELSGPLTTENRKERESQLQWTLQRLEDIRDWSSPEKVKAREEETKRITERILEMHQREQARAIEEYNRHLARLTATLPQASTHEALDKNAASEDTASPSPLPALAEIPTTPGVLLEPWVVRHYVSGCSFAGGETISGGPPTILECRAVKSKVLEEEIRTWITEDDRPLIYVKLQGPFFIYRIGTRTQRVHEVFDAQTGQLLMWGVTG